MPEIPTPQKTVGDLVQELQQNHEKYPKKLLDEIIERKEEITPCLLEILKEVIVAPEDYMYLESEEHGHILALYLLAYFNEAKAHDLIVELFSFDEDTVEGIFGDIISENLPHFLLRTCNGEMTKIIDFFLNDSLYEFCRTAGLEALKFAYAMDMFARDDLIQLIKPLFSSSVKQSYFLADLVCTATDIYPIELIDEIRNAYANKTIDEQVIRLSDVEEDIADLSISKCRDKILKELEYSRAFGQGFHEALYWYAQDLEYLERDYASSSYDNPPPCYLPNESSNYKNQIQKEKKAKTKRNKKNKQAKASRKTNRKKKK